MNISPGEVHPLSGVVGRLKPEASIVTCHAYLQGMRIGEATHPGPPYSKKHVRATEGRSGKVVETEKYTRKGRGGEGLVWSSVPCSGKDHIGDKAWSMTTGEFNHYAELKRREEQFGRSFTFPTRCKACRSKVKERKTKPLLDEDFESLPVSLTKPIFSVQPAPGAQSAAIVDNPILSTMTVPSGLVKVEIIEPDDPRLLALHDHTACEKSEEFKEDVSEDGSDDACDLFATGIWERLSEQGIDIEPLEEFEVPEVLKRTILTRTPPSITVTSRSSSSGSKTTFSSHNVPPPPRVNRWEEHDSLGRINDSDAPLRTSSSDSTNLSGPPGGGPGPSMDPAGLGIGPVVPGVILGRQTPDSRPPAHGDQPKKKPTRNIEKRGFLEHFDAEWGADTRWDFCGKPEVYMVLDWNNLPDRYKDAVVEAWSKRQSSSWSRCLSGGSRRIPSDCRFIVHYKILDRVIGPDYDARPLHHSTVPIKSDAFTCELKCVVSVIKHKRPSCCFPSVDSFYPELLRSWHIKAVTRVIELGNIPTRLLADNQHTCLSCSPGSLRANLNSLLHSLCVNMKASDPVMVNCKEYLLAWRYKHLHPKTVVDYQIRDWLWGQGV